MNKFYVFIIVITLMIVLPLSSFGGEFGLNFGFPFLGVKYNINKDFTTEFRLNYDGDIGIIGGRGYYGLFSHKQLTVYSGLELGFTFFNDVQGLEGNGILGSVFVGVEQYLTPRLSISGDIGPALISLNTDFLDEKISFSGLEWVINMSVNYYFK